jgi:hypothetical protein
MKITAEQLRNLLPELPLTARACRKRDRDIERAITDNDLADCVFLYNAVDQALKDAWEAGLTYLFHHPDEVDEMRAIKRAIKDELAAYEAKIDAEGGA